MKRLTLLLATLLAVPILMSGSALAWSPFGGVDCAKAASSAVCQDKNATGNPLTGTNGLLMRITNIVATIAGVAAVIILILAGLRFVTSAGGSEDVAGARRTIIYTVVGLVIIVLARSLISLVLSRL